MEVEQQATFPVHPNKTTTLKVRCAPPGASSVEFTLMLRVPGWATAATNAVTVNGVPVPAAQINPGAYIPLKRMWKDGDTVEASFPQTLRTEPLNDYHPEHNATLAFKYGPSCWPECTSTTTSSFREGAPLRPERTRRASSRGTLRPSWTSRQWRRMAPSCA